MRVFRIAVVTLGLLALSHGGTAVATEGSAPTATYVSGTIVESFATVPVAAPGADRLTMESESTIDWSDQRLPSRLVSRRLLDSFEGSLPEGSLWPSVNAVAYRLEGPNGAWTGVGHGFDVNREWLPTEPTELMGAELVTLTGEGAYAGLSAVLLLHVDALDWGQGQYAFEGLIYEGAPPPAPDPIEPGFVLAE